MLHACPSDNPLSCFSPLAPSGLSFHTGDRVPSLAEQSLEILFGPQILVGMVTVLKFFMASWSFSPCSLSLLDKQAAVRAPFLGWTCLGISHPTSLCSNFMKHADKINQYFPPSKLKNCIYYWKWKLLSCVWLPWSTQSLKFSRSEYWSGQPFPSPGDLPNSEIKPRSPALQVDSLPAEPQGKPKNTGVGNLSLLQGIFLTQELNQCLLHCRRFFTN